jgi:hypothetical protein
MSQSPHVSILVENNIDTSFLAAYMPTPTNIILQEYLAILSLVGFT